MMMLNETLSQHLTCMMNMRNINAMIANDPQKWCKVLTSAFAAGNNDTAKHFESGDLEMTRPLKKRRVEKKSVRFDDSRNTVMYREVSKKDLRRTWIQPEEYEAIKEDNKGTILALKNSNGNIISLDASKFCTRGLEEHIAVILFRAEQRRQKRFSAIIVGQHQQLKTLGVDCSPESLSALSQMLSITDRQKALRQASIDAIVFDAYSSEHKNPCKKSSSTDHRQSEIQ